MTSLAWLCAAGAPLAGSVTNDNSTQNTQKTSRIAVSPAIYSQLKVAAERRLCKNGKNGSASLMANIVLDKYLSHMEQMYFGRPHAKCCKPIPSTVRNIDAVIFGMDGVLCNSEQINQLVATAVFEKVYHVSVSPQDFPLFTDTEETSCLARIAEIYNVDQFDVETAEQLFLEMFSNKKVTSKLRAFPGVQNLIGRVKQLGLRVGVASLANARKVNASLNAIGLPTHTFDFVTLSDSNKKEHSAKETFLAAAEGLEVEPRRCVVVEDSVLGIQGALAAGMRCIAVATSHDETVLKEAGAHVVRKQPAFIELMDFFGEDVFTNATTIQATGAKDNNQW